MSMSMSISLSLVFYGLFFGYCTSEITSIIAEVVVNPFKIGYPNAKPWDIAFWKKKKRPFQVLSFCLAFALIIYVGLPSSAFEAICLLLLMLVVAILSAGVCARFCRR